MSEANSLVIQMGRILNDLDEPLKKRFRALFTLRNLKGQQSIDLINKVLLNDKSVLLKHECCYCLGQMNDANAIAYLIDCLDNKKENEIVRHEAAEALGNLVQTDDQHIIERLKVNQKDDSDIVNQTCELALELAAWRADKSEEEIKRMEALNPYQTKDPAPSFELDKSLDDLKAILLDAKLSLFDKYRCLFTLRNRGQPADIELLGQTLVHYKGDDKMSLFKHEIGYIFGQIQSLDTIPYLKEMVECQSENDIVRHECAEALGSIGTEKALEFLKRYLQDESLVVKQSCEVALDMIDYTSDDSQFNFIEQ